MIRVPVTLTDSLKKQVDDIHEISIALDFLIQEFDVRQKPQYEWNIRLDKIKRLIGEVEKHYNYHLNDVEDIISYKDCHDYADYFSMTSRAMASLDVTKQKLCEIGAEGYYTRIKAELTTIFYDTQEAICKNYAKIAKELANDH